MSDPIHLWLIRLIGISVPLRLRADWQQEWEAELRYRETLLADWEKLNWRSKVNLLQHSLGALLDALWLQPRRWEDEVIQDLRFGVRMLLKHKGFTIVAILSLTLGIGANTAIFQLIDAVRLRMLPVRDPHELVGVRLADLKGARGGGVGRDSVVTNLIWEQVRERQQAFSAVAAWGTDSVNLAPGGEERPARMLYVSGDYFDVLGIQPSLGRLFTTTEDQRGCGSPGLVISHEFWQREYGGEANVIGRKLTFADQSFDIIGVTPASFFGMEVGQSFDVSLPICAVPLVRKNNNFLSGTQWWLTVVGRLKPGCSLDQATAQMQSISSAVFESSLPANYPPMSVNDYLASKLITIAAGSGVSQLRDRYERSLWLLLGIGGSVLLIACANLANLLLARASARQREIAVRHAMGASRTRLIRQLLVESLLLAVVGAVLGAGLAQVLSRFLVAFLSTGADRVFLDLMPDWRVLGFVGGLAALTCLLFGLAPAIRITRAQPGEIMKSGQRGLTASRERFSLRRALAVTQVALSLVLVAGALLFARSLGNLMTVNTGFRHEGVLSALVIFQRLNLPPERIPHFRDELAERVRSTPGVDSAAVTHGTPINSSGGLTISMDGPNGRHAASTNLRRVGPNYFRTLEIPLLAGRDFNLSDGANAPKVAIVSESFARRFGSGTNLLGRRFRTEAFGGDPETEYEIVGLVRDTKHGDLREEFRPIVYTASAQLSGAGTGVQFLIRSRPTQAETIASVKRVLNEINPAITVRFQGVTPIIDATILRERLMATLSAFFGGLALLLACIGIYGLLSYGVASRTHEIGIRMALGAKRPDVFWLILREALLLVISGVIVGVPMIFALGRLAASLLFGVTPTDPLSLIFAALLMLIVAVVAGYLPSWRATRVDPMVALRCE